MKGWVTTYPVRAIGLVAAALCCGWLPMKANAQVVSPCTEESQIDLIAQPEHLNIRHFAKGAVLVAITDDGRDDAATALSVLILSPPLNDLSERQCRRISFSDTDGYAALLLDKAESAYDPANGLSLRLPAIYVASSESAGDAVELDVTVNAQTGVITPVQITATN
ncbi:hypothetical protein SAMN04488515_3486 [Cognatiyoonia koreensis]|uniref:Uncharacterized protein n=1 Tax=Cognatiyoonia koreensis TaxID=364200 RepID=A0A1I0RXZ2_9RHOB|nr:hypothetical protein [Cognatiyoonia koreensis]SEW46340.1 hypothetical protein SAMN04488515_3486 [Cognatiyoonia koreensis]